MKIIHSKKLQATFDKFVNEKTCFTYTLQESKDILVKEPSLNRADLEDVLKFSAAAESRHYNIYRLSSLDSDYYYALYFYLAAPTARSAIRQLKKIATRRHDIEYASC